MRDVFVSDSAIVSKRSVIGKGSSVWDFSKIRENVSIGNNCVIGMGVYVDSNVIIGDNVKIQNNVSIYNGVEIQKGAFIGPHVCFTNDKNPRSTSSDGDLKSDSNWDLSKTLVGESASIGANSTIICGVKLGNFCLIGAGSVVTKDVKEFSLVFGNPAKIKGYVCKCGKVFNKDFVHCAVCSIRSSDLN